MKKQDVEKILTGLDKINEAFYAVKNEFVEFCRNAKSEQDVKNLDKIKRSVDMRLDCFKDMSEELAIEYEKEVCRILDETGRNRYEEE